MVTLKSQTECVHAEGRSCGRITSKFSYASSAITVVLIIRFALSYVLQISDTFSSDF